MRSINNHYINCGVIQGFPALRKAVTTREKISYFFMCVNIANQLLTHHSVRLMNEKQSLHDSQYKLSVGAFSNYGSSTLTLKHKD